MSENGDRVWRVVVADTTALVALCTTAEEARALARESRGAYLIEPPPRKRAR